MPFLISNDKKKKTFKTYKGKLKGQKVKKRTFLACGHSYIQFLINKSKTPLIKKEKKIASFKNDFCSF